MKNPMSDRKLLTALGCAWLLIICFDVLYCIATTFRSMSFAGLWLNSLLMAFVMTLPYQLTRRTWVHGIVMLLTAGWLEANLMYCRTYLTYIPLQSYQLVGNLSDFGASVIDSLRWSDMSLAAVVVGSIFSLHKIPNKSTSRISTAAYTMAMAALAVVCWIVSLIYGGPRAHIDRLTDSCYYYPTPAAVYTVPGVLIKNALDPASESATPQTEARINAWLNDKETYRPFVPLPDSVGRSSNLVIIMCESLESWPLESRINGVEITPRLNRLIADSTSFYAPNMLTQVASGRSIDAQLLINAGMLPMENAVYSMRYPDRTYPSLSQAMKQRGARTYLVTVDKPITWNQSRVATAFDIDTLLTASDWRDGTTIGNPAKLADTELVSQSIEKMTKGEIWEEGEQAFVQWITYSGHNPFALPEDLRDPELEKALPADWSERLKGYVRMAHFTDGAIGELVDYLRSRSDADRTLILITGDHEGLGNDRADMHDISGGLVSDGPYTPLLLLNSPVAGRTDEVVGQIDVYPTLLTMLGLESYYWKGMGENLLGKRSAPAAISSMTRAVYGDTTAISPGVMRNLYEARPISDLIIRTDALHR